MTGQRKEADATYSGLLDTARNARASALDKALWQDVGRVAGMGVGIGAGARGLQGIWNMLRRNSPSSEQAAYAPLTIDIPDRRDEEKEKFAAVPKPSGFFGGHYASDAVSHPLGIPAMALGGATALGGGWKIMDWLLDQRRKSDMTAEVDKAEQEYEEALQSQFKTAGSLAGDLDDLFDMVEKRGGWKGDIAGMGMGSYLTAAGAGALLSGKVVYDLASKRKRNSVLAKAKRQQLQRARSLRPASIYVNPLPERDKLRAVPDEDELAGEPLDKVASGPDQIPGGKADNTKDDDFDEAQMEMGEEVEMEHTTDDEVAEEISRDHLDEFPDYYTRLKKMENEAKSEKKAYGPVGDPTAFRNKQFRDRQTKAKHVKRQATMGARDTRQRSANQLMVDKGYTYTPKGWTKTPSAIAQHGTAQPSLPLPPPSQVAKRTPSGQKVMSQEEISAAADKSLAAQGVGNSGLSDTQLAAKQRRAKQPLTDDNLIALQMQYGSGVHPQSPLPSAGQVASATPTPAPAPAKEPAIPPITPSPGVGAVAENRADLARGMLNRGGKAWSPGERDSGSFANGPAAEPSPAEAASTPVQKQQTQPPQPTRPNDSLPGNAPELTVQQQAEQVFDNSQQVPSATPNPMPAGYAAGDEGLSPKPPTQEQPSPALSPALTEDYVPGKYDDQPPSYMDEDPNGWRQSYNRLSIDRGDRPPMPMDPNAPPSVADKAPAPAKPSRWDTQAAKQPTSLVPSRTPPQPPTPTQPPAPQPDNSALFHPTERPEPPTVLQPRESSRTMGLVSTLRNSRGDPYYDGDYDKLKSSLETDRYKAYKRQGAYNYDYPMDISLTQPNLEPVPARAIHGPGEQRQPTNLAATPPKPAVQTPPVSPGPTAPVQPNVPPTLPQPPAPKPPGPAGPVQSQQAPALASNFQAAPKTPGPSPIKSPTFASKPLDISAGGPAKPPVKPLAAGKGLTGIGGKPKIKGPLG